MNNNLKNFKKDNKGFHFDGQTGSWGTDEGDGRIIADILRGIADLIKVFRR